MPLFAKFAAAISTATTELHGSSARCFFVSAISLSFSLKHAVRQAFHIPAAISRSLSVNFTWKHSQRAFLRFPELLLPAHRRWRGSVKLVRSIRQRVTHYSPNPSTHIPPSSIMHDATGPLPATPEQFHKPGAQYHPALMVINTPQDFVKEFVISNSVMCQPLVRSVFNLSGELKHPASADRT